MEQKKKGTTLSIGGIYSLKVAIEGEGRKVRIGRLVRLESNSDYIPRE